jgi:hypothetical protein
MRYINRSEAIDALNCMKSFHDECKDLYSKHGFNLLDNLGRRNIVMSQAQEKFFADVLSKRYDGVINDGRTGQPDIVIESLGKELECKLTSRHKSGTISFQSDYESLAQKGELDYLYVIADDEFKKFAVLHFEDLTVDDFRPLSNGSRGKVAMYKHRGMQKCNVLVGDAINRSQQYIEKISEELSTPNLTNSQTLKLEKRLDYWKNEPAKFAYELESVNGV